RLSGAARKNANNKDQFGSDALRACLRIFLDQGQKYRTAFQFRPVHLSAIRQYRDQILSAEIRRKLSLHQARNRLTWTWLALSGPLLLIVILQSINGKYGQNGFESLTGIGWLFQAVLPTASVMIAPITLPINPVVEARSVENLTLLWITISSFIFY